MENLGVVINLQNHTVGKNKKTYMTSRAIAMCVMIITSIVISFSGLIVRSIEHAGPWQINIYRSIAFISMIMIIIVVQYRKQTISKLRTLEAPVYWAGLCLGLTGVAYTQALTTTTIANTMFTMSAIPFIAMGLAYFFLKEKLTTQTLVAMGVSATGIAIMIVEGMDTGSSYGNLMAALTAFGFAGFAVILRSNKHIDMLPSLVVAGLVVILASIVPSIDALSITTRDLILCVVWGAGLSGIGHWVFVAASRFLAAAELTLFMLFEFALGPFWVWQFMGETPTPIALIGGLIVISSVTFRILMELRATTD